MFESVSIWMKEITHWLAETVLAIGYPGIVLLMAIESSFIPFPSEIVVPPAGYLAAKGEMNLGLVILAGLAGSMIGAYVNYYIAVYAGRPFIVKYGKYFLITEEKLDKCEKYFQTHGEITTFVARLLPGIRQLISFPAGLARMNLAKFTFYTALGAGIWTVILAVFGYVIGRQSANVEEAWTQYGGKISLCLIVAMTLVVVGYIAWYRRKSRAQDTSATEAGN